MMVPFVVALVAFCSLGGYLLGLERSRRIWLPLVEAAAARPVHVMVEHTGPLTPADPVPYPLDLAEDDDQPQPRRRPPTPTFYG